MSIQYVKGNCLQLFYHDGRGWKALSYAQQHAMTRSNSTESISSKDHGLHPDKSISESNFSLSGEWYWTPTNANILLDMADSGKTYTFCFAQVTESEHWADGIQPVTGLSTQSSWTPGSAWVRYADCVVTNVEISAENLATTTISAEFEGSGALLKSAPSTINSYSAATINTPNPGDEQLDPEGDDVTGDSSTGEGD